MNDAWKVAQGRHAAVVIDAVQLVAHRVVHDFPQPNHIWVGERGSALQNSQGAFRANRRVSLVQQAWKTAAGSTVASLWSHYDWDEGRRCISIFGQAGSTPQSIRLLVRLPVPSGGMCCCSGGRLRNWLGPRLHRGSDWWAGKGKGVNFDG